MVSIGGCYYCVPSGDAVGDDDDVYYGDDVGSEDAPLDLVGACLLSDNGGDDDNDDECVLYTCGHTDFADEPAAVSITELLQVRQ